MMELKVKGPNKKFIIQSLRCELKDKNQLLDLCKYRSLSVPNNKLSKGKLTSKKSKYFKVYQNESIQNANTQSSIQPRFQTELNQYTYYRVMHTDKDNSGLNRQFRYKNQQEIKKQFQTIDIGQQQKENNKRQLLLRPLARNISLNQYIKNIMQNKKYKQLKSNLIKTKQKLQFQSFQLNGQQISFNKSKIDNNIKNNGEQKTNKNNKQWQGLQQSKRKNTQESLQKQVLKKFCQKQSKQQFLYKQQNIMQKTSKQQINYVKYLKSQNKWNMIRKCNSIQYSLNKQKLLSSISKRINTQSQKQTVHSDQIYKKKFYFQIQRKKSDIHQIKHKQTSFNLPEIQILKSSLGPWDQQFYKYKQKKYTKYTKITDNNDIDDSYIKKRKINKFKC